MYEPAAMDAAPAPARKTAHVATAAEANCLRSYGTSCTLATARNGVESVGGPAAPLPHLELAAHELVVAHAWDSGGRLAVGLRRKVLVVANGETRTYHPAGEVKDLVFDGNDTLVCGTFAGIESFPCLTIRWPGRCCVCLACLGADVFTCALDGEVSRLNSDVVWTVELPGDRAQGVSVHSTVVVVATRLGHVVAFDVDTGAAAWSHDVGAGDDGGGTYTVILNDTIYAAGGGAWAAWRDDGTEITRGSLRPARCRGLAVCDSSTVVAALEAGDAEDAPGRRGEKDRSCLLATLALLQRPPGVAAAKLAKLEARFAPARDPFHAAVRPAGDATGARLAKLAARLGPPPGLPAPPTPPSARRRSSP